jgi:tocopherol O-methyltransferase
MIYPNQAQSSADVAEHYDELDPFYREVWGDHVHHGYWATGRETPELAVVALVDLIADRLGVEPGHRVCDIGCGYGATAQRLAEAYGAHVTGLTISPVQAQGAFARAVGSDALRFVCQDWLANTFADEVFDRVISIESSEHMADKVGFFREACRTLKPNGRLAVAAWLTRDQPRSWEVRHLLEPICREGRLPSMGTEAEYRAFAASAGLQVTGFEDLSDRVERTWMVCARRVALKLLTRPSYRRFLLDGRSKNRIFALGLLRLLVAYRTGSIRYGLLTAEKMSH